MSFMDPSAAGNENGASFKTEIEQVGEAGSLVYNAHINQGCWEFWLKNCQEVGPQ